MLRMLLIPLVALSLSWAVSACGLVRGSDNVDTEPGSESVGKGPGMVTGKRGGIVIYQR